MSAALEKLFMPDMPECFGLVRRPGAPYTASVDKVFVPTEIVRSHSVAYRVYISAQS